MDPEEETEGPFLSAAARFSPQSEKNADEGGQTRAWESNGRKGRVFNQENEKAGQNEMI